MNFPLPHSKIVERERYLVEVCRDKNVVHLGAAQASDKIEMGVYGQRIDPSFFLHSRISAVATSCLGLDYNRESIDFLRRHHQIDNILYANVEDPNSLSSLNTRPDIVIMGELLEHLLNPGLALTNIRDHLMLEETRLVITTPNALDISNALHGLLRREAQDPDHVATYSPRLLMRLCEKCGLEVLDLKYYHVSISSTGINLYKINRPVPRRIMLFIFYNTLLRLNAAFSSGLIVTAKRARVQVKEENK